MDTEKEYKIGDYVWIVKYPLAIRCKIIEIDNYFRQQNPTAYLFYDVDEPIGHRMAFYDFFDDREEAKQELLSIKDAIAKFGLGANSSDNSLKINREHTIAFIKDSWKGGIESDKRYAEICKYFDDNPYPDKKFGEEWFSVFDL